MTTLECKTKMLEDRLQGWKEDYAYLIAVGAMDPEETSLDEYIAFRRTRDAN